MENTAAQNAPTINNGRFSLRLVTLGVSAMCGLAAATGIALVFGGSLASLAAMGLSGFVVSNYSICWWRDNPIFAKHLKDVPIPKNQNTSVPMTYSEEYGLRVRHKLPTVNPRYDLGASAIKNNAPKPNREETLRKLREIGNRVLMIATTELQHPRDSKNRLRTKKPLTTMRGRERGNGS